MFAYKRKEEYFFRSLQIITAGGKNVGPAPIEDRIKALLCDVVSNVVVIGDRRKFLSCLMTLKVTQDAKTSQPTTFLTSEAVAWCDAVVPDSKGKVLTIQDFREGPHSKELLKAIEKQLEVANGRAMSKVTFVSTKILSIISEY
jgi:long-chain-fatty-acid--CoA ligase ACSBG